MKRTAVGAQVRVSVLLTLLVTASTVHADPGSEPIGHDGAGAAAEESRSDAPAVDLRWSGYVRTGYEWVQNDPSFAFVGENSGFVLQNARLTLDGTFRGTALSFRISMDAADEIGRGLNTPQGERDVSARDVYARYDILPALGVQVGQFKAPFAAEELRSRRSLPFASSAVGIEGVRVGRGLQEPGLRAGRQLGVMLSSSTPLAIGPLGIGYALALTNGNGANQALNDNNDPALFGRLELSYERLLTLGGAIMHNPRRVGAAPTLFDETDLGVNADLLVQVAGLELYGQWTQVTTTFDTVGTEDLERRAWHAHVAYRVDLPWLAFAPAYRIASLDPRANIDDEGLVGLDVLYHTIGLNLYHPTLPVELFANYTLTTESDRRSLDNDRLELILQLFF